jgi:hypothetical protein
LAASAISLPITGTDVIGAGVTQDIIKSVFLADIGGFFADDDR